MVDWALFTINIDPFFRATFRRISRETSRSKICTYIFQSSNFQFLDNLAKFPERTFLFRNFPPLSLSLLSLFLSIPTEISEEDREDAIERRSRNSWNFLDRSACIIAFKNCDGRLVINAREQRKFHGIARFSNTKIRFPLLFFFFPSRISNRIEYFHVTAILVSWRDARAIKNYRRFPGNPADSREINASNREFLGKRYFCPNSFQQRFLGVSQGRAAKRRRKEEMEERRRRKCFFFFYFGDRLLMDFSIELIARPLLHDKFPR